MKRANGFLNIDGYFIKKYKRKYPEEFIKKINDTHYIIEIDGDKYYFKKTKYPYTELLAYEAASFLEIPAIEYDLAYFQSMHGVISKDYKKDDANYISGQDILFQYLKNMWELEKMGLMSNEYNRFSHNAPFSFNINNLEVIWQAIETRYKKLKIDIDIKSIMDNLILYFIFNILTLQCDGMSQNWVLEEKEEGVSLAPIFDNEMCFLLNEKLGLPNSNLSTNFNDIGRGNYKILEEFLKISSEEYVNLFQEKFNMLTIETFNRLINNVESKIESQIPMKIKEEYIKLFNFNRQNIEEVLEYYLVQKKRN